MTHSPISTNIHMLQRSVRDLNARVATLTFEKDALEEVLRDLASSFGAGGHNAVNVNPTIFDRKIREGVDMHVSSARHFDLTRTVRIISEEPDISEQTKSNLIETVKLLTV